LVRDHLEGQILRFEPRQLLIRAAGGMGIDRFQANLIIAAVQHAQPAPPHAREAAQAPRSPSFPWGASAAVAVFLIVEAVTAFAVWEFVAS
jgi:hypothetical protein